MQGLHLTADLFDCQCAPELLTDEPTLRERCTQLTEAAGLTIVGAHFHTFPPFDGEPGGITGMLLLAESHLAIHTWPERGAVTLDVYVCNFQHDNSERASGLTQSLIDVFQPAECTRQNLWRGNPQSHELALEWLTPTVAHGFGRKRALLHKRTAYQRLELDETEAMGRVLTLDGAFMVSERDEFIYHECMVHVPALTHPEPKRALIIGGGDGGAAEEMLKHPSITRVTLAELDGEVIDVSRQWLQNVHGGVFDNPRLHLHVGDGLAWLREHEERQDIIVMDLGDPQVGGAGADTPAIDLYGRATFELVRERLADGGVLTLHLGASPFFQGETVARILADLRAVFNEVHPYRAYMPIYGAEWGMAMASMSRNPRQLTPQLIQQRLTRRGIEGLRFYTPALHPTLFVWPAYAKALGAPIE